MSMKNAAPVIASEAKQSSPSVIDNFALVQPEHGLLRCARNDGVVAALAWSLSFPAGSLVAAALSRS